MSDDCYGEDGLPIHLPIGVDDRGRGPTEPDPPHSVTCWCIESDCMWTRALADERKRGYAEGLRWAATAAAIHHNSGHPVSTLPDVLLSNADRQAP